MVEAPENVSVPVPTPPLMKSNAPETTPDIVAENVSATCTVDAALKVTSPARVPLSEKLMTPEEETPVPATVNGSLELSAAATSSAAPDDTVVP